LVVIVEIFEKNTHIATSIVGAVVVVQVREVVGAVMVEAIGDLKYIADMVVAQNSP